MKLISAILFLGGCSWGQSGIEVPSIGVIVDSSGALRQVQGVAGSFLLGPAGPPGVISAACSEQLCLVKTDSKILSATGEIDAPPGPVVFGFSGDIGIVFFPEPRTFARWHADTLDLLDWTLDGEVLSLSGTEIAVQKDGEVSIVHPDGSIVDSMPDASGPVLLLPTGVVFATKDEIVLRQGNSEIRFELAGAENITAMGPGYAAIHTGAAVYALRIDPGRESLLLLPGNIP
jgi:hypothetical protein